MVFCIFVAETHLTADSCLCDACYRHVDRKANCPSYKPNKKRQHHRSSSSQIKSLCCVHGCSQIAEHQVRRKWLIKLKRSIAKKVCRIKCVCFVCKKYELKWVLYFAWLLYAGFHMYETKHTNVAANWPAVGWTTQVWG